MSFEEIIERMTKDRRLRLGIVRRNHIFFFYFYFAHYAQFKIASFQEEMFHITQDTSIRNAVIVGFRGCSKSTIFALSFPLWAILGEQHIKHVVILSKTQQKAQMLLQQMKYELENNELLKKDLGPFKEERNGWNSVSLNLLRYNAKITAASTEQSIRSSRHMQYRPQLIIVDDCEDLESVKTIEGRDKTYNWFVGDIIPSGEKSTRIMVIGSLLHEDSLIKRLAKSIAEKKMAGIYREYPLLDQNGNPTWLGRYPDQKSINDEKTKGIPENAWQREYLLRIIPDENQVVRPEWIQYYDRLPDFSSEAEHRFAIISADLAISQETTADFTAIIVAEVYGYGKNAKIYILPDPINERLTFPETVERLKTTAFVFGSMARIIVEDAGYQKSVIQQLANYGLKAEGFTPHGQDKRARLSATTQMIQSGRVLFPRQGAEKLICQLTGFGAEKHDDLADSFSMIVLKIIEEECGYTEISFIWGDKPFDKNKYSGKITENQTDSKQQSSLNNKEERKRLEREMDLETMRRDLNQYQSGRFLG